MRHALKIGETMHLVSTVALAGVVTVLPTSCGNGASPTQPTFPANYAGTWSGQCHVIECSRSSGLGPSVCDRELAPPGASDPLRLTLTQSGLLVSGTVDLFDNTGKLVVESGEIDGAIDQSHALVLTGMTNTTDPFEPSQSTLKDWTSSLTDDGRAMTGRFTRYRTFQNFWGKQEIKKTCELMNFRRAGP